MKETQKKKNVDLTDITKLIIKLSSSHLQVLSHPTRNKIIELCSDKPRTISELQKLLNFRYSAIWNHVKTLEGAGLIELKQDIHSRGKSIKVYIKKQNKERIESIEEMLKGFKKNN